MWGAENVRFSDRDAFADYEAAISACVYPIRLELSGQAASFEGHLCASHFGGFSLIDTHANTPLVCTGRRWSRAGASDLMIKYQVRGQTSYVHRDRAMLCDEGSLALFCGDDDIDGEQHCPARAIIARLPSEMVTHHARHLYQRIGVVAPAGSAAARLLGSTLAELWEVRDLVTPSEKNLLPLSVLKMIELAFSDRNHLSVRRSSVDDPHYQRILDTVRNNISSQDLDVSKLCRHIGVSRSSLYTFLAAIGTTPERLIFETRLDVARAKLEDPRLLYQSIGTIAFSVGFQDLSHFSRRFRKQYGSSPGRYRKRQSCTLSPPRQTISVS